MSNEVFAIHQKMIKDSLDKKINTIKNPKQKINLLINYSKNLEIKDPDLAIKYCKQAYALSNKHQHKQLHATSALLLAQLYQKTGNIQPAINFFLICSKLYEQKHDPGVLINIYNTLGSLYLQNKYNKEFALANFLKSLKCAEEINDHKASGKIYNSIGKLYFYEENYDKAASYFNKAYNIGKRVQDSLGISSSLNNMGEIARVKDDFNKALSLYKRSLKIHKLIYIEEKEAINYKNIGLLYYENNNSDKALEYFKKGLQIANKIQNESMIADLSYHTGKVYLEANKYTIAKAYFDQAIANSRKSNDLKTMLLALTAQGRLFEERNMYKDALITQKLVRKMNDSINMFLKEEQIAEIQARFHFQQQQKELALKEKENSLLKRNQSIARLKQTTLISLLVIIIMIGFIIVSRIRLKYAKHQEQHKKKQEQHKAQKKQFETEIDQKKKDLTELALHIVQKNDYLTDIQKELKKLKKCKESSRDEKINDIYSNISAYLQINKELQTLEQNINEHHENFFVKLAQKFPSLSKNEQQLCAFLRLNLSTKEIASLKNASIKSVEMGRYRLRKKLGLNTNDSISDFLKQI